MIRLSNGNLNEDPPLCRYKILYKNMYNSLLLVNLQYTKWLMVSISDVKYYDVRSVIPVHHISLLQE